MASRGFSYFSMSQNRAILFIDGNNWYHGLKQIQRDSGSLDYRRLAERLLIDRDLRGIRYYIGRVLGDRGVSSDRERVARQKKVLKRLESQQVQVFLGRIEKNLMRPAKNPMVRELQEILTASGSAIPTDVLGQLDQLCNTPVPYYVEKQVDVRLAIDLVRLANQDEYDVAYLLSADGDFVPAVEEARRLQKKVFAASPIPGKQLAQAADSFIRLRRDWFYGLEIEDL